ncbi:hypothetical protein P5V15_009259 [Pogonomyrmex californicus]
MASHRTVPYRTVPYRTVPYRTVPYRTVPYRTVPYRTVPYRTVPYRTVPYRTVPYRTVPYRTVPYRTAPHRTAPDRTASYRTANTAFSRYCKLLTAPCYSAHGLLSATPSSATPAPLLSTACGTIKSQLSYHKRRILYPYVRVIFPTFYEAAMIQVQIVR